MEFRLRQNNLILLQIYEWNNLIEGEVGEKHWPKWHWKWAETVRLKTEETTQYFTLVDKTASLGGIHGQFLKPHTYI